MSAIDHLLCLASIYGAAEGIEASTVSWRVFGDTKKLGALGAGGDIQVRRSEAAFRWFSDNWPPSADWPSDIPRPQKSADNPETVPDPAAPVACERPPVLQRAGAV